MNEVKNYDQSFKNILRTLIDQSGLSNKEISKRTKIGIQTIEKYLSGGGYPTFNNLITLANFFAVPLDYLAGRCSIDQSNSIIENYSSHFMEMRHASYEAYLSDKRSGKIVDDYAVESPWPYNLLDNLFKEPMESITQDQEDGINYAICTLNERMQKILLLYFKEYRTKTEISRVFGISTTYTNRLLTKALRILRHPSRSKYIKLGLEGVNKKIEFNKIKSELDKQYEELTEYKNKLEEMRKEIFKSEEDREFDEIMRRAKFVSIQYDMDFTVRTANHIRRYNCDTLFDLILLIKDGHFLRNIARHTANEIIIKICMCTGITFDLDGNVVKSN